MESDTEKGSRASDVIVIGPLIEVLQGCKSFGTSLNFVEDDEGVPCQSTKFVRFRGSSADYSYEKVP